MATITNRRHSGDINQHQNFTLFVDKPLDDRFVIRTQADLFDSATWKITQNASNLSTVDTHYEGLFCVVTKDSDETKNGLYWLPKKAKFAYQSWDDTALNYDVDGWRKLYDNTTPISSGTTLQMGTIDYDLGVQSAPWGEIANNTLKLHLDPGKTLTVQYGGISYGIYSPFDTSVGNLLTIGDHLKFTKNSTGSGASSIINKIDAEFISAMYIADTSNLQTILYAHPDSVAYPSPFNTASGHYYLVIESTFGYYYICDVSSLQTGSTGVNTLSALYDTSISNALSDGDYLMYDSTSHCWINTPFPTIPVVPTNISAFTNDVGYITSQVNSDWNATSGPAEILNKPTIPTVPTDVSVFNNDAGYITAAQVPQELFFCYYDTTSDLMYANPLDTTSNTTLTQQNLQDVIDAGKFIICDGGDSTMYYLSRDAFPMVLIGVHKNITQNAISGHEIRYIQCDNGVWSKGVITDFPTPVQSNWNETDTSSPAFILNKPNISSEVLVCIYNGNNHKMYNLDQTTEITPANIVNAFGQNKIVMCFPIHTGTTIIYYLNVAAIGSPQYLIRFVSLELDNNTVYQLKYNNTTGVWDSTTFTLPVSSGSGTSAQVQSNWSETDPTSAAYILNKPTIPNAVSGVHDGINWTSITIGNDTKTIPSASGGGGSAVSQTLSVSTGTIISGTLDESYTSSLYLSGDGSPVIFEGVSPESNGTGTDIRLVTTTETLGANPHDNILFKINTIDGGILTLTQEPTNILFPRVRSFSSSDTPSDVFTDNHIALKYGSPLVFSGMVYDNAGTYTGYNHMFCVGDTMQNIGNTTSALDLMLFHVGPYYGGTGISVQNNPSDIELGRIDLNISAGSNITLSQGNNGDIVISASYPQLAMVATSGSYTDLSNTPTIPTSVSDLTNDVNYITSSDISIVSEMANSEVWSFYTGATNQGIVITASERMQCILFDNTGGRDAIPISFAADTGYTLDFIYSPNSEANVSVPSGSRKLLKVRFVNSNTLYYELIDLYSHHPSI